MRRTTALLLVGICQFCFAAGQETTNLAMTEWSKPVANENGQTLRGRLIMAQGNSPAHADDWPETQVYLELQNVSAAAGPPILVYVDFSRDLHCLVLDGAGKGPPTTGIGGSGVSPDTCRVALPYDSTIRLRANMYGYCGASVHAPRAS
jgi:hypothetical protein